MEYDAVISGQDTPLDVIKFLQKTSSELYRRIGGAVCPSNTLILPNGPREWVVLVKWVLPMDNFAVPGAPDPDELAMWILEQLPPKDPAAMGSSKGVYVDVDLRILDKLTHAALEAYQ